MQTSEGACASPLGASHCLSRWNASLVPQKERMLLLNLINIKLNFARERVPAGTRRSKGQRCMSVSV